MDSRLLDLYNRELIYFRKRGAEFAQEFPKIAGRLGGLDDSQVCPDPFVERLLEGVAFLSARVQLKFDAEFPQFTQSILNTVYPHYLSPTPSMTIVQFQPDADESGLAEGFVIPRGSSLYSKLGKMDQTRCEYKTAHNVVLWPLELVEAEYCTRGLSGLKLPPLPGVKAGLRLRLKCTAGLNFSQIKLDTLSLHLKGADEIPMQLYEQLFANSAHVVLQSASRPEKWQKILDPSCIQPSGFHTEERLLPYDIRSFQGYRLLHEYFAFPRRFMFVELCGLANSLRTCSENQIDVLLLFNETHLGLESVITSDNVALFCSPAVNLFEKRIDRIHITDRFAEFHVVPDKTRPLDYEVYSVLEVTGYGLYPDQTREFYPLYRVNDYYNNEKNAYYVLNRYPRSKSEREKLKGTRSRSYMGSEVYISLVDTQKPPFSEELKQLGVVSLCTNRDLPLQMPIGQGQHDFTLSQSAPCASIRCSGSVTPPAPSHAEGELSWRAINHLSLNYFSLADTDSGTGVSALRDILRLYSNGSDPQVRKQIDGIRDIKCVPVTRRIATAGFLSFARGLQITVTCEEAAFVGSGVFLLGAVLEQFFAKYVSINSFTETILNSVERGELMRWPMRAGLRQII